MKILIADDDPQILRALRILLTARGYEVLTARSGAEALSVAVEAHPDLVMLDLGMPQLNGIEVSYGLRGWSAVPILVVSGRTGSADKVDALDAGADDYVTKPFRLAELLARVRALLRRGTGDLTTGAHGVKIYVESHRAWLGDDEMQLSAKEFELLRVLVRDAGRVVTREQIMREVWDTTWWTSTKTLDMHISWLRKKLGDDAASPRYITTVRGVGFRFEKG